jgi:hypothetical protein
LGADIKCDANASSDIFEAIDEPAGHFGMQEVDAAAPHGAVAVHSPGVAVEQGDRDCGYHCRGSLETTYRDPSFK